MQEGRWRAELEALRTPAKSSASCQTHSRFPSRSGLHCTAASAVLLLARLSTWVLQELHFTHSAAAAVGHVISMAKVPLCSSTRITGAAPAQWLGWGGFAAKNTVGGELVSAMSGGAIWWQPLRACSLSRRCKILAFIRWTKASLASVALGN